MSEKIRGALFNALGDIKGLNVLDAYSGTGALAIESISRGASFATAIDIDKNSVAMIKESVKDLGIAGRIKVIRANITGWSENNSDQKFDIVMADPPFDKLKLAAVKTTVAHVKNGGLFCLSWPGNQQLPVFEDLKLIADKSYGDAKLGFYKKTT